MSDDLQEYQEKLLTIRIKELEKQRDELYQEISRLQKPDCNRMIAEKLGTTTRGCNCQQIALILVQNGEVKSIERLSPLPCHLREIQTKKTDEYWKKSFQQIGEGFYKERTDWEDMQSGDFDESLAHIPRHPKYVPIFQINGKYYYQDECHYADEVMREVIYDYDEEIQDLPNGIYYILFETACYAYTTFEGTEGDIDTDIKIYPHVPLWEFLKYKEDLLAEADSEAEELVDTYLYIQQTKQMRHLLKKPSSLYIHSNPSQELYVSHVHSDVVGIIDMPFEVDTGATLYAASGIGRSNLVDARWPRLEEIDLDGDEEE
jgi:hypothetical protein